MKKLYKKIIVASLVRKLQNLLKKYNSPFIYDETNIKEENTLLRIQTLHNDESGNICLFYIMKINETFNTKTLISVYINSKGKRDIYVTKYAPTEFLKKKLSLISTVITKAAN